MPTARQALLDAAHAAVVTSPWNSVRMTDVATRAGVSRQTLYNEFGTKDGLGLALVEQRLETLLHGAGRAAGRAREAGADVPWCVAAAAGALLDAAAEPVVRAVVTGHWRAAPLPSPPAVPPPGGVLAALRDGVVAALGRDVPPGVAVACETGLRLALSHLVAPQRGAAGGPVEAQVAAVVRALLG